MLTLKVKKNLNDRFRLLGLELNENSLLGTIKIDFTDGEDNKDIFYSTVLIGPNGTGKSNILRIVINLMKELYDLSIGGNRSYDVNGDFSLIYSVNGEIYEYTSMGKVESSIDATNKIKVALYKDGLQIEFKDAKFPSVVIANSIMLTDKYPIFSKEGTPPFYKYLGIRNRAQNASTRQYVRKTVEFIVEQNKRDLFRKGLRAATKFLDIGNNIDVQYWTVNTKFFFTGELKRTELENYFENIRKKYSNDLNSAPFKLNSYTNMLKDINVLDQICEFCNKLVNEKRLVKTPNSPAKRLSYHLTNDQSFEHLKNESDNIERLRLLGMISPPEIKLRGRATYDLTESSSGEYHFFSSMVGLLATAKPNCLIFIDEPEVSLHPNWQMKYMTFLRDVFGGTDFASSHIVIATHSHFIVSDLKGENSKLIGLKLEDGIRSANLSPDINTYGWSAENVLLNVFGVATSRNLYIAERLGEIFKAASQSKEIDLDKYKVELLMWHQQLREGDPLHYTISKLIERMGWQS